MTQRRITDWGPNMVCSYFSCTCQRMHFVSLKDTERRKKEVEVEKEKQQQHGALYKARNIYSLALTKKVSHSCWVWWFEWKMSPTRLKYLNTWTPAGKEVMKPLGAVASPKEARHWRWALRVHNPAPLPVSFFLFLVCAWRHELPASCSGHLSSCVPCPYRLSLWNPKSSYKLIHKLSYKLKTKERTLNNSFLLTAYRNAAPLGYFCHSAISHIPHGFGFWISHPWTNQA